ncbi:MAG: carotenoid biosynthesis protein [Geobacter sp.]|nr:carotenoid biosynthesis protein [Geobacter sp.]
MAEFFQVVTGTVITRPYVFAFFAVYLLAAIPHIGWKRVTIFTIAGYLVAFSSELASINTGFPYGWYYYIDKTSSHELWVAGVPFFDSISYVFLSYCSYATALFILSPLKRTGLHIIPLETVRLRRSLAALLLGALLQTYLDIIIDPVALQGDRWFLGRIYGYRESGYHFGVPLSNYVGWFFVSLVMIFILQRLAATIRGLKPSPPSGIGSFPGSSLIPPALYLSVIIFNISIAVAIGEMTIALSGFFAVLLPVAMALLLAIRRINRHTRDELAEHLTDFPWSAASSR